MDMFWHVGLGCAGVGMIRLPERVDAMRAYWQRVGALRV